MNKLYLSSKSLLSSFACCVGRLLRREVIIQIHLEHAQCAVGSSVRHQMACALDGEKRQLLILDVITSDLIVQSPKLPRRDNRATNAASPLLRSGSGHASICIARIDEHAQRRHFLQQRRVHLHGQVIVVARVVQARRAVDPATNQRQGCGVDRSAKHRVVEQRRQVAVTQARRISLRTSDARSINIVQVHAHSCVSKGIVHVVQSRNTRRRLLRVSAKVELTTCVACNVAVSRRAFLLDLLGKRLRNQVAALRKNCLKLEKKKTEKTSSLPSQPQRTHCDQ